MREEASGQEAGAGASEGLRLRWWDSYKFPTAAY